MKDVHTENFNIESQAQKRFSEEEQETWKHILQEHEKKRRDQIVDLFDRGLKLLEITPDRIPSIEDVNQKLKQLTGFQGVMVNGLEDGNSFYQMLAQRLFPIGNFIRDNKDLNYTPEPDIVHDLYGHLPFFTDSKYSDFCESFGKKTCEFLNDPERLRQFERFFWFTAEFGLVKTPHGNRIFGAGISSSIGECEYALSDQPKVLPFNVDLIRNQEFRIDEMQKVLFLLESEDQLYNSLDELYEMVKDSRCH